MSESAACVFPRCVEGEKPPHCGNCEGRATPYAHEYGSSAAHRRERPREETEARLLRERGTPEERIGPVVPDGTLYPDRPAAYVTQQDRDQAVIAQTRPLLEDFKWLLDQHPEHDGTYAQERIAQVEAVLRGK